VALDPGIRRYLRQQSRTHEPNHRVAYVTAGCLTAAAFGPYLLGGIRTEQAAVYGTVGVGMLLCLWLRVRPSSVGLLVLGLLVAEWLVAFVGAALPALDLSPSARGSALAGLDNLTLPIAALGVAWMLQADGADPGRLTRVVCRVTVAAMCVNAVVAFWSQTHDLTPLLRHFWDSQGLTGSDSVAGRSAQLGRFTGIFNQPAEAGLMYSIALLAAVFLLRQRPGRLAAVGAMLIIGGVLTVSKVFLLVGLPVALWQTLRSPGRQRRFLAFTAAAGVLFAAGRSDIVPPWIGGRFLNRLFHPDGGGLLELYTAGRFGQGATLHQVTAAVLRDAPGFGFGAGGLAVPYDNGWVEALAVAGIAGACLFTAVLVALWWAWHRSWPLDGDVRRLAGGLLAVATGASVGLPALTANRCATVVWLLLALLIIPARRRPASYSSREPVRAIGVDADTSICGA
jgi:hypothetical protein